MHLQGLLDNLKAHGGQIIENEDKLKTKLGQIQDAITKKVSDELVKRLGKIKTFVGGAGSFFGNLITLQEQQLEKIPKSEEKARAKQKRAIRDLAIFQKAAQESITLYEQKKSTLVEFREALGKFIALVQTEASNDNKPIFFLKTRN